MKKRVRQGGREATTRTKIVHGDHHHRNLCSVHSGGVATPLFPFMHLPYAFLSVSIAPFVRVMLRTPGPKDPRPVTTNVTYGDRLPVAWANRVPAI